VIPIEVDGFQFFVHQNLFKNSPLWDGLEFQNLGKFAVIFIFVRRSNHAAADGLQMGLSALVEMLSEGSENYVSYLRLVSILKKDGLATDILTRHGRKEKLRKVCISCSSYLLASGSKMVCRMIDR
jgi:hypothetical protein